MTPPRQSPVAVRRRPWWARCSQLGPGLAGGARRRRGDAPGARAWFLPHRADPDVADFEPDVSNATFTPNQPGLRTYRIEGWSDPIATWRSAVEAKLAVGQSAIDLANDLKITARLLDRAAQAVPKEHWERLWRRCAAMLSCRPGWRPRLNLLSKHGLGASRREPPARRSHMIESFSDSLRRRREAGGIRRVVTA